MTAQRPANTDRVASLRDFAVSAAMRHGRFEASGDARLVILHQAGLMIAYRTPFNPLPKFTEGMKFEAALQGRSALREPYGIEIWDKKHGKVLSVGWRGDAAPVVDGYEHGPWEQTLAAIARHDDASELCGSGASALTSRKQPFRGELNGHAGSRKRTQIPGRAGGDG
jgi:hypothetical protein